MSSNPLLKTKLPYANSAEDLLDKYNYSAKTINSSTMDIGPIVMARFIDIQFLIAAAATATLTHGLGSTPTGWIVIDNSPATTAVIILTRDSWTTNTITLTARQVVAGNVNFKIRVFI